MRAGTGPEAKRYSFDTVIKCCTYLPALYSFLVGRILLDNDPAAAKGRATVEKRIDDKVAVTPMGLMPTPMFGLLYKESRNSFGKARSLKCPHYLEENGNCGVWKNRESTCSTWFCKHVRGNTGYAFWRTGLHNLLQAVEIALSRWCLLELKVSEAMLLNAVESNSWKAEAEQVDGDSLDQAVSKRAYSRAWCEWEGREREFYIACAEKVSRLSWWEVLQIAGPEAQAFARLTVDAYKRLMSEAVPDDLVVGSFELVHVDHGTTRLRTYSEYDPVDIPSVVMELLPYFDGRPTQDVVASIAAERGIQLEPALVLKMADFALLTQR